MKFSIYLSQKFHARFLITISLAGIIALTSSWTLNSFENVYLMLITPLAYIFFVDAATGGLILPQKGDKNSMLAKMNDDALFAFMNHPEKYHKLSYGIKCSIYPFIIGLVITVLLRSFIYSSEWSGVNIICKLIALYGILLLARGSGTLLGFILLLIFDKFGNVDDSDNVHGVTKETAGILSAICCILSIGIQLYFGFLISQKMVNTIYTIAQNIFPNF